MILVSDSREETLCLGALLGETAIGGEVVGLVGPLGAGKSCLVKGIARGLGMNEADICSPTFILAHSHFGRLPLHHIDLYRTDSVRFNGGMELEDYFDEGGITAIEWADQGAAHLPEDRLTIEMRYGDPEKENQREISLMSGMGRHAAWVEEVIREWTRRLPQLRGR